jgi:formylglycine-generating enzyme required for sulfatase activity
MERRLAASGAVARVLIANPRSASAVPIPDGRARIGCDGRLLPHDGEGPSRRVRIERFRLAATAVTNAEFQQFVQETRHVTDAERFGWSLVFQGLAGDRARGREAVSGAQWRRKVHDASWKAPEGPGTSVTDRQSHPVVHVSWHDAQAFAHWSGGRLPSEAEWVCAAKGGLREVRFPWGDREPDDQEFMPCNVWQGEFPHRNTGADGYLTTAPVDAYAPNGYGLYNMVGNVWEWCEGAFCVRSPGRHAQQRNELARRQSERIMKGGSYLCRRSYCYRYRIAARLGISADTSTGHVGFRIAFDDRRGGRSGAAGGTPGSSA